MKVEGGKKEEEKKEEEGGKVENVGEVVASAEEGQPAARKAETETGEEAMLASATSVEGKNPVNVPSRSSGNDGVDAAEGGGEQGAIDSSSVDVLANADDGEAGRDENI